MIKGNCRTIRGSMILIDCMCRSVVMLADVLVRRDILNDVCVCHLFVSMMPAATQQRVRGGCDGDENRGNGSHV